MSPLSEAERWLAWLDGDRRDDGTRELVGTPYQVAQRIAARLHEQERSQPPELIALKWKRTALDLYGVISQVHWGMTTLPVRRVVPDHEIEKLAIGLLKDALRDFESKHPVDSEAGWERDKL